MKRPPTDYELLREIRDRHYEDYVHRTDERQAAIFVPVDIPAVATNLGVSEHSVFGRLYHHLDQVYGQEPDEKGRRKAFFTPVLGHGHGEQRDVNCINFPLMEAVLAGLWIERSRDLRTVRTSAISLGIAVASLALSVLVATGWI